MKLKRKIDRVSYYFRNIVRDLSPSILFRRNLKIICTYSGADDWEYSRGRVEYYNKIHNFSEIESNINFVKNISMGSSCYYYDLKEHARFFPRNFRIRYRFGDITTVPDSPSIVKSRPANIENSNSIVMNLDKFRHFYFPRDEIRFEDKKPIAVWRGGEHNSKRLELMRRYRGHNLCDIGFTNVKPSDSRHGSFLRPTEQMAFKYIISIEGNDVATNLKWILASNSLCMMPKPKFETWFMEGRLKAGEHYVELGDTFEELEDKIIYYERHPGEAQEIIRNANAHVDQFLNKRREQVISLLVLYKYFVATRQIDPDDSIAKLVWP